MQNTIQNDYSRQINILDPSEFKEPVHIIGAGTVGSWMAMSLAKMGIENITLYDFDEVGMHNLPNQCFTLRDIGKNKAKSMRNLINLFTGFKIKARDTKLEGGEPLSGIVFVLTDTMRSRKDIYLKSIKNNPNIKLMIETRSDLRGFRIYAIDPKDEVQTREYEATLYDDSEAEVSACGVSQTLVATSFAVVSKAIWAMLGFLNGELQYNELVEDLASSVQFTQKWGKFYFEKDM